MKLTERIRAQACLKELAIALGHDESPVLVRLSHEQVLFSGELFAIAQSLEVPRASLQRWSKQASFRAMSS